MYQWAAPVFLGTVGMGGILESPGKDTFHWEEQYLFLQVLSLSRKVSTRLFTKCGVLDLVSCSRERHWVGPKILLDFKWKTEVQKAPDSVCFCGVGRWAGPWDFWHQGFPLLYHATLPRKGHLLLWWLSKELFRKHIYFPALWSRGRRRWGEAVWYNIFLMNKVTFMNTDVPILSRSLPVLLVFLALLFDITGPACWSPCVPFVFFLKIFFF